MRIIKKKVLEDYWQQNRQAKSGLQNWYGVTRFAEWAHLGDVRATFPHADPVVVRSGKTVVVFNISGDDYRLITAIHYNTTYVYTLMAMTHAEYSKNKWKDRL